MATDETWRDPAERLAEIRAELVRENGKLIAAKAEQDQAAAR